MTAAHSIVSTVLVAIDISKHRHEVLIGIPGKKRRRRLTIINHVQHPEPTPVFQRVLNEVEVPPLIWPLWDRYGRSGANCALASASFTNG